jgi:hypothetical protein
MEQQETPKGRKPKTYPPAKRVKDMPEQQKAVFRAERREQKRRERERKFLHKLAAIEQQKGDSIRAERERRRLVCFGEIAFGGDARTADEEIEIHRLFLRALAQPDVQPGETLRALAKRAYEAWVTKYNPPREYAPAYSLVTHKFDADYGFAVSSKPFEEIWVPPKHSDADDADALIDMDALPSLPIPETISKPEKHPVVPAPVAQVESDDDAEHRVLEQKRRMNSYIGLGPDAIQYLTGDKR